MESMYIGLVYIALGILIKFFPGLLAGYSTLTNSEKDKFKINGVPIFAMIVFCIMGVILLIGHFFIAPSLDQPQFSSNLNISVTLIGMVILIIGGNIIVNLKRSN